MVCPVFFNKSSFKSSLIFILLINSFIIFANGGVGYKGIYINSKGTKTWYKAHNVSWGYNGCGNFQFNSASNFSGLNLGSFTTVETLQIAGFAVIGWTDNSDWVAGQLAYKVWKQGDAEPGWSYIYIGNYGNNNGASQVVCTSGTDRVIGYDNGVTSINPGLPGNYNIKIQAFGRMQYNGGNFNVNDGTQVTATFTVTDPITANTDYFRSKNTGDWTSIATWQSSPNNSYWVNSTLIPDANASSIVLKSGHIITLNTNASVNSLVIESGATFIASDASPRTFTISKSTAGSSTTLLNSGTWHNGSGGSTVIFSGAPSSGDAIHAISGSIGFQNVTFSKTGGSSNIGVSFGANSVISGTLEIGPGGFVATAPPTGFYANSAILKFNQGSGATYDVNAADYTWSSSQVPQNITISSGTVNLKTGRNVNGYLRVDSGSNLTLISPGTLTINPISQVIIAGTANFGGQSVILKSDATGTAKIGQITGSLTGATNVTVERYIPGKRAWRALTAPLKGSTNNSIFYNWQNNGSVSSGVGVELWGPGGTGSAGNNTSTSGLSYGPGASIKQYGNGWSDVTDTKTTSLFTSNGNNAYVVFVTGGYGSGNISSGFADTTLKSTGQLITGSVSYTGLSSTYHTLIGNPYACPIHPSSIVSGATNLFTNVWVWDPALGTNGGYVNYDGSLGAGTYSSSGGSYPNNTIAIQSGQAFFVRAASGTGSLTLTESMKSGLVTNTFRNNNSNMASIFRVGFLKQTASDWMPLDGCIAGFYEGANAAADEADGKKMINTGENIGFVRNAVNLSSEHYPLVTAQDILYLKVWNTQQAHYKLKLNTEEFTMTGVEAWLQDLYTGTSQQLNLDGSAQDYEFDVDPTVSASSGNRFRIVFTNTALAVTNPEQGQLSIYPNPATGGKVTVSLPTGNFEGCSYELINVLGQVVRQHQIENGTTSQVSIPITGLPNSWYALRIIKENSVLFQGKLIIKN